MDDMEENNVLQQGSYKLLLLLWKNIDCIQLGKDREIDFKSNVCSKEIVAGIQWNTVCPNKPLLSIGSILFIFLLEVHFKCRNDSKFLLWNELLPFSGAFFFLFVSLKTWIYFPVCFCTAAERAELQLQHCQFQSWQGCYHPSSFPCVIGNSVQLLLKKVGVFWVSLRFHKCFR